MEEVLDSPAMRGTTQRLLGVDVPRKRTRTLDDYVERVSRAARLGTRACGKPRVRERVPRATIAHTAHSDSLVR